jgi:hypothetical protein
VGITPQVLSWDKCCGTMCLKEHQDLFEKNLKSYR